MWKVDLLALFKLLGLIYCRLENFQRRFAWEWGLPACYIKILTTMLFVLVTDAFLIVFKLLFTTGWKWGQSTTCWLFISPHTPKQAPSANTARASLFLMRPASQVCRQVYTSRRQTPPRFWWLWLQFKGQQTYWNRLSSNDVSSLPSYAFHIIYKILVIGKAVKRFAHVW